MYFDLVDLSFLICILFFCNRKFGGNFCFYVIDRGYYLIESEFLFDIFYKIVY